MSGDRIKLEVREREQLGSRHTRRLRKQGLIPGVLYGDGSPVAIVVGERELRAAVTGPSGLHAILDVVVEGKGTVHPSVMSEYQRDPIRGTLAHFDLREVDLNQPITATVTVNLVGEAPGTKTGGVLSLVGRELRVEALPMNVPEHIDVDVSSLDVGDVLRLEDIPALENVTFLDDPHETVIANVTIPRALVEPEVEEAELEEGEEVEGEPGESPEASAEGEPASDESDEE